MSERKYECLLTRKQVAEMLNCSVNTVINLEQRGKLPLVQLTTSAIRFKPEAIQAYIDGREIFIKPKYN